MLKIGFECKKCSLTERFCDVEKKKKKKLRQDRSKIALGTKLAGEHVNKRMMGNGGRHTLRPQSCPQHL